MIDNQLKLARLHDWQVGRFSALEDTTGIDAEVTIRVPNARTVTHQPVDFGMFAVLIDCRNRMTRRQLGQLDTPAEQEAADTDEEGIGSLVCKSSERCVDFADGAGVENPNLRPYCSSRSLQASQRRLSSRRIGRIDERVNTNSFRQKLTQELQPLCHDFGHEDIDPGQVAVRLREAGDKT